MKTSKPLKKKSDISKIKEVLVKLEPYVVSHGGSITFKKYLKTTGVVEVVLDGSCAGCAMSVITLRYGLEEALKKAVRGVKEVRAV